MESLFRKKSSMYIFSKIARRSLKMMRKTEKYKKVTLYNLIFPIWLLVWIPSWFWLILLPANYCIDRLVFTVSSKKQKGELSNHFFRKHTWKLWLFGFLSDFIGSVLLVLPLLLPVPEKVAKNYNQSGFGKFMNGLQFNAFSNVGALLYTLFAVAVSGLMIYLFDRRVIFKTGEFTKEQTNRIAFIMAIITAPYLYLLPTSLFL